MSNYAALVDSVIKAEMTGNPRHEQVLDLGQTPEYLITHAQLPTLPLVVTGSVVCKAHFDHGIPLSILKRLPEILHIPLPVYRSANPQQTDSVVVITLERKGQAPIIAPIRQNRRIGRNGAYNILTSLYGKEGPDPATKWSQQGLLIYQPP